MSSVRDNLSTEEWYTLKTTPIFLKETDGPHDAEKGADKLESLRRSQRFKACDLYLPIVELRELALPLLEWRGKWDSHSKEGNSVEFLEGIRLVSNSLPEASFMHTLGLQSHLQIESLISLAASATDDVRRDLYIQYIIKKKDVFKGSYNSRLIRIPFLPAYVIADGQSKKTLETPNTCFSNSSCAVLNFPTIVPQFQRDAQFLGVREHPDPDQLVERLESLPPSSEDAESVFSYLSSRQSGKFIHTEITH
jgi:hypothetical protein